MGRPRTPTSVLDARGAFKKHPERKRAGEPVVTDPIGAPPDRLNKLQVRAWHEVVARAPLGVLTAADFHAVEQLCVLLAESWEQGGDFPIMKRNSINKMLGQLGMTPSDRARLSIAPQQETNPFDDF